MRIQIWHVVVLIIAFVLLFGWKNLPNIARSMGESMRVFKSEVDQMKDDGEARKAERSAPALDDRGATPAEGYHDNTRADSTRRDPTDHDHLPARGHSEGGGTVSGPPHT